MDENEPSVKVAVPQPVIDSVVVFEFEQVPVQLPLVGQLQPADQVTLVGE